MKILHEIVIEKSISDIRLHEYCEQFIDFFESRKSVKKAIKKSCVLLNNTALKGGAWVKKGDKITIIDLENTPPKTYELGYPIVFEDDYLAIINKPAGLIVSGNQFKTLANSLMYNLQPSKQPNALAWPLPVHRIDSQTSGLIIAAKTKTARIALGNMFEHKTIEKVYKAIVMGKVDKARIEVGNFSDSIDEKAAYTEFKVLSESRSLKNDWLSLLELKPKTGRTHQLRIHLSQNGTPILGDKLYSTSTIKHKGLFLCACQLRFIHPITKKIIKVSINLPRKFEKRLKSEQKRWDNYKLVNGTN
ncbi:MAG: pseudouridine synthase [Crocinitomicaceae bacterium]